MINLEIKNTKSHHSLSLAKANASRDLQINFNQAEDALTIPTESRHDYKCGSATQSGRSMIEMLGVLAIIGVLSVGGIAGYSKAMMKYRINKTIEQITLIAGNVRAFWGPQKNYIGVGCDCYSAGCDGQSSKDGCPIVKKAKILPDEMITVTDGKITSITNPFGYEASVYGVRPYSVIGGGAPVQNVDPIYFRITYDIPLDYEVCIELMSHDWTAAGVKGIVLQGPNIYSAMMPISIETAVDKCSSCIKDLQNYHSTSGPMGFYFDLKNNCTFYGPNVFCS